MACAKNHHLLFLLKPEEGVGMYSFPPILKGEEQRGETGKRGALFFPPPSFRAEVGRDEEFRARIFFPPFFPSTGQV